MSKRHAIGTHLGLLARRIGESFLRSFRGRSISRRSRRAIHKACIDTLENRTLLSTYYVATYGSNSGPGTLSQPFKTIQEAANAAYGGDSVLIMGGTYHESVSPPHSGVTFAPYQNQSVTVTGADPISGFYQSSGSIYEMNGAPYYGQGENQVFVDGQMMNEARWPATSADLSHQTYATIQSYSNGTIYDSAITQPANFWNGALIHITPGDGWVSYVAVVNSSGPGWVNFTMPSSAGSVEQPIAGNSFYLYGTLGALNSPGEYYVSPSGNMYIWDQYGDNPQNHDVEVKNRAIAFNLEGITNTTIQGLNIFAAGIESDWGSTSTLINGINASYASQFSNVWGSGWSPPGFGGIELSGQYSEIENSTISWSAGDGIFVGYNNITVTNNIIHDVDYNGVDGAGIAVQGNDTTVTNNLIYNTGRDGILFQGSQNLFSGNTIHDFMLQTNDGGGIYTIGNSGGGTIDYNVMYNGHTYNPLGLIAAGIMLDNNSANFVIHDNITSNVDVGFKANGTSYNEQVYNNQFGATQAAIATNGWVGFAFDWSGSNVYDNVFYNSNVQLGANIGDWGNSFASGSPTIPSVPTAPPPPTSPPPASPPPASPPSASPPSASPPSASPPSSPPPSPPSSPSIATSIWSQGSVPPANQNIFDPTASAKGGVELGLEFQSSTAGYITGVQFYKSSGDTGVHTGELWSTAHQLLATATFSGETASGWQQVLFPSAVAINANTVYIISYHTTSAYLTYVPYAFATAWTNSNLQAMAAYAYGGNGTYAYGSSSVYPANSSPTEASYGVDVVFSTTASSVSSIWSASSAPISSQTNVPDSLISNNSGVELGLKFDSSQAGEITGVQFYKGSLNTGTHIADLWNSSGQLLATATFTNESSGGWQTVYFSSPVAISANTTYIVSYHTTSSYISYTAGGIGSSGVVSGPLTGLAGVYSYGANSLFPSTANGQSPNYWVNPLFQAS